MKLGCANIKNYPDMTRTQVQEDARRMATVCDLWGQQENEPREDAPAIMATLDDSWRVMHQDTNLPVYYKHEKYRIIGVRVEGMPLKPDLDLVPKPRLITGTTFRLTQRPGVPPFVIINVHFIAGGYNGPTLAARKRQWDIEWAYLQAFITDYKRRGFTVFVIGDFNRPRPPRPTTNFMWLVGERLDRIGVTRTGGVEVDETDSGTVELNSDHNGQWSRVLLSRS